ARGSELLRPPAAGGVRGPGAVGDALPDRLSDCGATPGLGGRDAGAPASGPARPPAGPAAARGRVRRAARAPVVGRVATAHGCSRLRPPVGRAAGGGTGDRRGGMSEPLKIAVISPVWFPVPPTGYGGIE